MKKYAVTLEGVTPYMQHKMNDAALKAAESKAAKMTGRAEVNDEDEVRADAVAYIDRNNGKYFIPNSHIKGALITGGSYVKAKVGGKAKSLKQVVAAMFFIAPERIYIPKYDEIDIRSAVNQKIKGRIIVIRPKWNSWRAEFVLTVDDDAISLETIKSIITYAGSYVGIGSFRPTNNGEFGRFELKAIEDITDKDK